MTPGRALNVSAAFLVAACTSRPLPPALVPTGESLPEWNYAMAAAVVRSPSSGACVPDPIRGNLVALQLLGWRVVEFEKGQRDEALWWGYFLTANGPEWLLAMTFREPVGHDPTSWRFSRSPAWGAPCGRPIYQRFTSPLSNPDVVGFFHTSGAAEIMGLPSGVDPGDWFHPTLLSESRWVIRKVVVRTSAWEAALGSAPPAEFQP